MIQYEKLDKTKTHSFKKAVLLWCKTMPQCPTNIQSLCKIFFHYIDGKQKQLILALIKVLMKWDESA